MPNLETAIPYQEVRHVQKIFVNLLNPQNQERSMVIVLASVLEEIMEGVLGLVLPPSGIPYTAGGKIQKLRELNLVDDDGSNCLNCIRKIRNHYAHEPDAVGMRDAAIVGFTQQLSGILQRVFNIQQSVQSLDARIQGLLDGLSGPGNTWATRFSDDAQMMRNGFLFLAMQLLAIKSRLPPPPAQTPLPLGQFTIRTSSSATRRRRESAR